MSNGLRAILENWMSDNLTLRNRWRGFGGLVRLLVSFLVLFSLWLAV